MADPTTEVPETTPAPGNATPATPATETTTTEVPATTPPDPKKDPDGGDPAALGDPGRRALDAERRALKAAEKRAKDAEGELKKLNDAKLSEQEKLQRDAEDGRQKAAKASERLQRANLLTAVSDTGLAGGKAKAATRLLSGLVEFDDEDEPKNLTDAIEKASAEYGADLFAAAGATPALVPVPDPALLAGGARTSAEPDETTALLEKSRARMGR